MYVTYVAYDASIRITYPISTYYFTHMYTYSTHTDRVCVDELFLVFFFFVSFLFLFSSLIYFVLFCTLIYTWTVHHNELPKRRSKQQQSVVCVCVRPNLFHYFLIHIFCLRLLLLLLCSCFEHKTNSNRFFVCLIFVARKMTR